MNGRDNDSRNLSGGMVLSETHTDCRILPSVRSWVCSAVLPFFFRGSGIHNTRSSPHGSTEARVTDNRAYNLSL